MIAQALFGGTRKGGVGRECPSCAITNRQATYLKTKILIFKTAGRTLTRIRTQHGGGRSIRGIAAATVHDMGRIVRSLHGAYHCARSRRGRIAALAATWGVSLRRFAAVQEWRRRKQQRCRACMVGTQRWAERGGSALPARQLQ